MRKLGGGPSSQVEKIIFEIQEEEFKGKNIYIHIYMNPGKRTSLAK